ncbi:hypothetical protein BDV33DRAFT_84233 [Aspergillus novoparasiticus]|uniref:Uncharacterized protein n=1 Tax=Aspergillus novoparasiticus TaxID=986946 RepID=A0A5N6E7I5_9EURO|nr:hypothetical protein BDV33DRAFT_84233 [Aspergillus novoparasiticus]
MIFGIYSDTISSLRPLRGPNGQMQNMPSHSAKERPSEVSTVKGKQPEQEKREAEVVAKQKQEEEKKKQEDEDKKKQEK